MELIIPAIIPVISYAVKKAVKFGIENNAEKYIIQGGLTAIGQSIACKLYRKLKFSKKKVVVPNDEYFEIIKSIPETSIKEAVELIGIDDGNDNGDIKVDKLVDVINVDDDVLDIKLCDIFSEKQDIIGDSVWVITVRNGKYFHCFDSIKDFCNSHIHTIKGVNGYVGELEVYNEYGVWKKISVYDEYIMSKNLRIRHLYNGSVFKGIYNMETGYIERCYDTFESVTDHHKFYFEERKMYNVKKSKRKKKTFKSLSGIGEYHYKLLKTKRTCNGWCECEYYNPNSSTWERFGNSRVINDYLPIREGIVRHVIKRGKNKDHAVYFKYDHKNNIFKKTNMV